MSYAQDITLSFWRGRRHTHGIIQHPPVTWLQVCNKGQAYNQESSHSILWSKLKTIELRLILEKDKRDWAFCRGILSGHRLPFFCMVGFI